MTHTNVQSHSAAALPSKIAKLYLLNSAFGLFFVALAYGLIPSTTVPMLTDIAIDNTDSTHVFRALMSVYLGILALWILGAFNANYTRTAVVVEIAFMGSLALGRAASIAIDGMPSAYLLLCLGAEAVMAVAGMIILQRCRLTTD